MIGLFQENHNKITFFFGFSIDDFKKIKDVFDSEENAKMLLKQKFDEKLKMSIFGAVKSALTESWAKNDIGRPIKTLQHFKEIHANNEVHWRPSGKPIDDLSRPIKMKMMMHRKRVLMNQIIYLRKSTLVSSPSFSI
jgi:hypothetical protein